LNSSYQRSVPPRRDYQLKSYNSTGLLIADS
jgi:hypothetical protein